MVEINLEDELKELEKNVRALNVDFENGSFSTLELLEHIDDIERLGLGYRFHVDIRRVLDIIASTHKDIKGLLSLYEASHLAFIKESELHEAKLFAMKHLLILKGQENDAHILEHIDKALEVPLYQRMLRLQARWWKNIGLAYKLSFVRDRLMECFFWTVGIIFEPQYHSFRVGLTKVGTLITVIDDIYDVYGSVEELEIFTDAVKRWDINAMEHMPKYLQLCFGALYNLINEMGYNTSIPPREDITPILVKVWGELLEAFLVEAKWIRDKYIPTLQDYVDNAWLSESGVLILTHGYFLVNQEMKKEVVESLERYHDLMKWSSMLFRLYNDLATATVERGETANAISCYMHENGVCEEVARAYIATLIDEAWMKLIKVHVVCS
ncbi:hypothetical protein L1987_69483 [Smallanthus sonchifolius]|uniref:Uncharacterized protein n=1 Tax=Smallanthus sonchifolius TaxID=185202 RepID=A0ACB9B7B0_9ASTR|nr:hypothetical protein L1987_69483 [Smallanthus sonchifolius]